jgi:NADH-quinone oxidoreductase subunit B
MGLEHKINPEGVFTTKLEDAVNWARKHSLFQYPFVTACCGMEYMATAASRYDIARFGAEIPRFSPRQADLLWVVGTVNHKLAPFLQRIYEQISEPKWVISFGVCASTGGFYDNYATVQGIDKIIPVDVYIPGCPPRPEQVLDGLLALQAKIEEEPWLKYAYEEKRRQREADGGIIEDAEPLFRKVDI